MTIEETKEEPDNSAGVLTRSGNETTHNNDKDQKKMLFLCVELLFQQKFKWKTIKIIRDSQSSLKAIQNPTIDSKYELRSAAEDLIKKLTEFGRKIIFELVPSHSESKKRKLLIKRQLKQQKKETRIYKEKKYLVLEFMILKQLISS